MKQEKTVLFKIAEIALPIIFVAASAFLSYLFTDVESDWYLALRKPVFQPPGIVFSVIWAALFALFAASFALVSANSEGRCGLPYVAVGILLPLWCFVFFTLQSPFLGLLVLIMLFAVLFAALYCAGRCCGLAVYLLLPLALWTAFAIVLNYCIVMFN